jgi:hypothetical protein
MRRAVSLREAYQDEAYTSLWQVGDSAARGGHGGGDRGLHHHDPNTGAADGSCATRGHADSDRHCRHGHADSDRCCRDGHSGAVNGHTGGHECGHLYGHTVQGSYKHWHGSAGYGDLYYARGGGHGFADDRSAYGKRDASAANRNAAEVNGHAGSAHGGAGQAEPNAALHGTGRAWFRQGLDREPDCARLPGLPGLQRDGGRLYGSAL